VIRTASFLALVVVLASCASRRPALLEHRTIEPKPPSANPPERVKEPKTPRWLPASDEVWLLEMIAQRLEISMAAERGRRVWGLPEPSASEARAALFAELASRAGLAPVTARAFFAAQQQAAEEAARIAERKAAEDVRRGKTVLVPTAAETLLDAVEAQMIATLARLRGIPSDDRLVRYGREKLEERGLPRRAAVMALKPLQERSGELQVFTTSDSPR